VCCSGILRESQKDIAQRVADEVPRSKHGAMEDEVRSLMAKGVVKVPDNVPSPRAEG
jgi:hypothetical protein